VHVAGSWRPPATAEILVTSTVKDLVAGSKIGFDPRGRQSINGVDGEWDLFAVAG
jgi:hypothetical protein